MKIITIIFLFFLLSCSSKTEDNTKSFLWDGYRIFKDNSKWFLELEGFTYPGNKQVIEDFLVSFDNSNKVLISANAKDVIQYYNIGKNSINGFSLGLLTPGALGRYTTDESGNLYMIEGDFAKYPLHFDWRDKRLPLEGYKTPLYFHFKPINFAYTEVLIFNDSTSIINYNNLLRSDIIDLVPYFDGNDIGEIEIKYEGGELCRVFIKKGANGYLLNLKAPYSYLISEVDFLNIIGSF